MKWFGDAEYADWVDCCIIEQYMKRYLFSSSSSSSSSRVGFNVPPNTL